MRRSSAIAALAAILIHCSPVAAAPADAFRVLLEDHYTWLLRENPVQATALGVRDHDTRIDDISAAARDRRAEQSKAFLARLEQIEPGALTQADQVNRSILKRLLEETVEANRYGQRLMLFTTYAGWHQSFASLANYVPFRTRDDYRSYLARLAQYPVQNDAALAITREALAKGHVLPCSVLTSFERGIAGVIADEPARSRFYEPFTRTRPDDISLAEWAAMQEQVRTTIIDVINPAYAKHRDFFRNDYLPKCSRSDSIASQPGGAQFYAFRVRQETTTEMTPDQIHQIGVAETARIRAEMEAAAKAAGYSSRLALLDELRTNPRHFAKSPSEMMAAAAVVAKAIDGKMPGLFATLPRLSYGLREIPPEIAEGTTTAYYGQGAPESGIAGTFFVNTSRLDQRPLWELPALTMHEAVPGHHHQIALQQELDLPPFRRNFAFFTAFTEGWGLYAESLGEEMGLYDTPDRKMGQLSYQAWRAARLVVDTGIHAKGWDKARAVAFMRANTGLTDANIDAEVNRYISWPGQALGYKLGELRIRGLRTRARQALGARFDLRRFHDAVLLQGSVPLDVLEAQIDKWITEERKRR